MKDNFPDTEPVFTKDTQAGAQPEHDWTTIPGAETYCRNCGVRAYMDSASAGCPNGAQVPSPVVVFESRDAAVLHMRGLLELAEKTIEAQATHLNTIKSYVKEAQVVLITREDMHDPLKAQTFFDEAKGFERLVLSEIGGGK